MNRARQNILQEINSLLLSFRNSNRELQQRILREINNLITSFRNLYPHQHSMLREMNDLVTSFLDSYYGLGNTIDDSMRDIINTDFYSGMTRNIADYIDSFASSIVPEQHSYSVPDTYPPLVRQQIISEFEHYLRPETTNGVYRIIFPDGIEDSMIHAEIIGNLSDLTIIRSSFEHITTSEEEDDESDSIFIYILLPVYTNYSLRNILMRIHLIPTPIPIVDRIPIININDSDYRYVMSDDDMHVAFFGIPE